MVEMPRIRMLGRLPTSPKKTAPLENIEVAKDAELESSTSPPDHQTLEAKLIHQVETLQKQYAGLKDQMDQIQRQLRILHSKPTRSNTSVS